MAPQQEDNSATHDVMPTSRSMFFTTELLNQSGGSTHPHFAGRQPAGTSRPMTVLKKGVRHIRHFDGEEKEVMAIGLACSECFHGPRLAEVIRPGLVFEQQVFEKLLADDYAPPLAIHTSAGVSEALGMFIDALEPHLPWPDKNESDWCVSLQLEGASAVWAAVDMLLQVQILETGNKHRKKVAVASTSYHGPPSTSFGSKAPMWSKTYQVKYPSPVAGEPVDIPDFLQQFEKFLDENADDVGVMLIEPQWGSMQCALPWPKELLQEYVRMAQARGIKIVCDEIMCGLGRHGMGTMFIAEAWELPVDAITFGKAVAAGVYPLSGAIMKTGRDVLSGHGRSVMQSHTFAGAHARALITGAMVLNELPNWFEAIAEHGENLTKIFKVVEAKSQGMMVCHGQGLMWGGLFTKHGQNADEQYRAESVQCFKRKCDEVGILPYHTPVGGFMVSPVVDIDVETVYEFGEKLEEAVRLTVEERGWKPVMSAAKEVVVVAPPAIPATTLPQQVVVQEEGIRF
uniref:Uncharacterized protein n=1 Tax=Grammatophora oceanica TaxID=210454 RepID=A0A6U5G2Y6_9STRA|mmetsp:Transcript_12194/g.17869  ORF Transcript_12194/g.17869 Transcript_12194/m.17869 type:complete len:514 (+) Transcript_12194:214-1755(+)